MVETVSTVNEAIDQFENPGTVPDNPGKDNLAKPASEYIPNRCNPWNWSSYQIATLIATIVSIFVALPVGMYLIHYRNNVNNQAAGVTAATVTEAVPVPVFEKCDNDICGKGNCQMIESSGLDGNYTCHCDAGYQIERIDGNYTCLDINECKYSTDPCGENNTYCHNTEGSYDCNERVKCGEGQVEYNGQCHLPIHNYNKAFINGSNIETDSSVRDVEKMFDNNDETYWQSEATGGGWIELILPCPQLFEAVVIKRREFWFHRYKGVCLIVDNNEKRIKQVCTDDVGIGEPHLQGNDIVLSLKTAKKISKLKIIWKKKHKCEESRNCKDWKLNGNYATVTELRFRTLPVICQK